MYNFNATWKFNVIIWNILYHYYNHKIKFLEIIDLYIDSYIQYCKCLLLYFICMVFEVNCPMFIKTSTFHSVCSCKIKHWIHKHNYRIRIVPKWCNMHLKRLYDVQQYSILNLNLLIRKFNSVITNVCVNWHIISHKETDISVTEEHT